MGGPGSGRKPSGGGGSHTRSGYTKGSKGGTIVKVNSNNIHKFSPGTVKLGQKIKFKHSK